MAEQERVREREPEQQDRGSYEQLIETIKAREERSLNGQVVVRGKDVPLTQNRMSLVKSYLHARRYHPGFPINTVLDDWAVFVHVIKTHSGKHRHQGGIIIFVIEGEGYTEVDGERLDWEAGDMLLLPLKPGGVEHKHFNRSNDKPAKWIAFVNSSLFDWSGTEMVQLEQHPDAAKAGR